MRIKKKYKEIYQNNEYIDLVMAVPLMLGRAQSPSYVGPGTFYRIKKSLFVVI